MGCYSHQILNFKIIPESKKIPNGRSNKISVLEWNSKGDAKKQNPDGKTYTSIHHAIIEPNSISISSGGISPDGNSPDCLEIFLTIISLAVGSSPA